MVKEKRNTNKQYRSMAQQRKLGFVSGRVGPDAPGNKAHLILAKLRAGQNKNPLLT
jgi:hypothetical protein